MTITVDTRGLSCPQPVILVDEAIEQGSLPIEVLADSETSVQNVRRLAQRRGVKVLVAEADDEFRLTLTRA